jgi:large subunit ribosomal protein L9
MAAVELILLQRVDKLGQMGDKVKVKPGYARNYLLPQKKALRANKENLAHFETQRAQLEAQNIKRREEAERLAERVGGLTVVIIRQAGESGSLYGSVSARDISDAATAAGLTINRSQVVLEHPIKTLGLAKVRVSLHPEVSIPVTVNVARSPEEAERQARGESAKQTEAEEDEEQAPTEENIFEGDPRFLSVGSCARDVTGRDAPTFS